MCTPSAHNRDEQSLCTALTANLKSMAQLPGSLLEPKDPTASNITLVPSLTVLFADPLSVTNNLPTKTPSISYRMAPSIVSISQTIPTTLATRTTDDVIADLKQPLRAPLIRPLKDSQDSSSPRLSDKPDSSLHISTVLRQEREDPTLENDEGEDEGEGDGDDDDQDDARLSITKPGKISERKKRLNAIADKYVQSSLERASKKDSQVKPEDEKHQSARWLINQSESQEIISTPREYQTELFERAKEKNIIAVLDTGLFHPQIDLPS